MENRKISKRLPTPLTDEEKLEFTGQLVNFEGKLLEAESQKKSAVDRFNADMKETESSMHEIFTTLRRGEKESDVECLQIVDEATKQIITKRLDTGVIIDVRKMVFDELQRDIPFDEIEYEESPIERHDDILINWIAECETAAQTTWGNPLLGREVTDREVRSWIPEQYRVVENWVMLVKWALDNPDAGVDIGETPEVLLNPVDLGPEEIIQEPEPNENKITMLIMVDGKEAEVEVRQSDIPAEYGSRTFDPESGEVTFWDDAGVKVQICQGRIVTAEVEEEALAVDEAKEQYFVFDIEGERFTVTVKKSALPQADAVERTELNTETLRVSFFDKNDHKLKSAKATLVAKEPIEPESGEAASA